MDDTGHLDTTFCPPGVCVLTAGGMAAIASIALWGKGASAIMRRLFSASVPDCGHLAHGTLKDGQTVIDSIVAACEQDECFVLHCHGNPLLVEHIVTLCRRCGATLRTAEAFWTAQLNASCRTPIEAEAKLAMAGAATLEAVELLAAQITGGLSGWAAQWIECKSIDINRLRKESDDIRQRSQPARYLIDGVRIALVGPPNSGKSTLLNRLAAEEAAIVSDVAGTTRDWISTTCRIGPLRAEVIDTAGLNDTLAAANSLDRAAQKTALKTLKTCDLVLNIQDCTQPHTRPLPCTTGACLTVFTKSDLWAEKDVFTPTSQHPWVLLSALTGDGLGPLNSAILAALKVDSMDPQQPVCFTQRQHRHLSHIGQAQTLHAAKAELDQLSRR